MKKILLGSAALIALGVASQASAADLGRPYTKAPPMMAAIYDWTGFYIGVNGGYASGRQSLNYLGPVVPAGFEGRHTADGGIAGGQIGYRWQASSWVFGLEAQGDWADLRGSAVSLRFPATTNRTRIDSLGLFTGQVGYAWNNALLYAKGGAAVAHDRYDFFPTATGIVTGRASENRVGASAGAGLEFGFAPNWSAGVEYNHLFLGNRNITYTTGDSDRIRQDVDMVTARINYRWGGPVVAKY